MLLLSWLFHRLFFFFFNDTATTEIYTLSLHDALPISLIGSAAISFLMSFENFNTTLMLVGADPPLTVMMYGRMREGASPVLNAVSLFLMLASAILALSLMRGRSRSARPPTALS